MRNRLMLAALAGMLLAGCAERRFVTNSYWHTANNVYISYAEFKPGLFGGTKKAKIMRCTVGDDNSVACADQDNANTALNP